MTNFEMNLSLFKIAAYTAIGGTDPERQLEVFGEAPENVVNVSLEELFQAGPILDHGKSHPVDKLLKSLNMAEEFVAWLKAGGSPLLATTHDGFPAYKYPPILGYLDCLLEVPTGKLMLRTNQFKQMSLEQWRRGTDDQMVASGILRGLSRGVINSFDLGVGIPEALFDAFKNPTIEAQVVELLKSTTFQPEEKCVFENAECLFMTAYVFDRLGLNTLRQAVLESPAFRETSNLTNRLVAHMLWAALSESNHSSFGKAQQFLQQTLGIEPGDPVIDQELQLRFQRSQNAHNREYVYERATRRMEYLIEIGALWQVKFWLKDALPFMERFPEIPPEQKAEFIAACKIGETDSVMEVLPVFGNQIRSLSFILRELGREGFVEAYRKTCERAVYLETRWVEGQTFNLTALVGPTVKTLKEHGLVHDVLDCLIAVYEPLWAGKGKTIQQGDKNFAVELQLGAITKWVGAALTAEPCNERAVAWFKRFEHPLVQELFVAAIPTNQAVFRQMNFKQRAVQFSKDLGL